MGRGGGVASCFDKVEEGEKKEGKRELKKKKKKKSRVSVPLALCAPLPL